MALNKKPVNGMKDIMPEEMQICDHVKIFNIFHTGCLHWCKSEFPISLPDHTHHMITDLHFFRHDILHSNKIYAMIR